MRNSNWAIPYLQLAKVIPELLKTFFESDEAGRDLRGSDTFRLHHLLLIEQSLEPELKLRASQGRHSFDSNLHGSGPTSASFWR